MKTPETDIHEYEFINHDDCAGETLRRCHDRQDVSWQYDYIGPAVPSKIARKLEREKGILREALEKIKEEASSPFENRELTYLWAEEAIAKVTNP